jgi:hypothetical protein
VTVLSAIRKSRQLAQGATASRRAAIRNNDSSIKSGDKPNPALLIDKGLP